MTIFGKTVSEYIRFLRPILGFILVVGMARLLLSLAGVSVASVKYFSLTGAWLVGLVVCSITVHTKGFGSYKQLLGLVGVQSLVAQAFTAAVVVLAIVTGQDNIYSLPEFSGGSDGKTWSHAGAHLFLAAPILTLAGWLIGSAILLVTKKVSPAVRNSKAPRAPYREPKRPESFTSANAEPRRATAEPQREGRHIFISYRRGDSADTTGRIYDRVAQHFGKDAVFKDVDSIPLGIDFQKHLQEAVGRCSVLLAIIGRSWVEAGKESGKRRLEDPRDHLRIEIETALRRDIPVIPVLVQGGVIPEAENLPDSLKSLAYRNGLSVRPDPDFHPDMDRLIKGIQAHLR